MIPSRLPSDDARVLHIHFRLVSPRAGPGSTAPARSLRRGEGPPISAFVSDLDRTLLRPRGRPTRAARTALEEARRLGLRTLLASGRPYPQLRRFAREFGHLDGIVAENGAVVEAPLGTAPRIVGGRRMAEARRRLREQSDLQGEFGRVVVSVRRTERRRLLRAIAGLPVQVVSNVDRLMVVPDGVTKRSGARSALLRLGLPRARYAAIGDAENDLDLLRGARLAGAVGNAEPAVRAAVDYVCRARFEWGVREFVRGPLSHIAACGFGVGRR